MKVGVVMDPIHTIKAEYDSTLSLLWEAQDRDFNIFYFEPRDLFLRDGKAYGLAKHLKVFRDLKRWFSFGKSEAIALDTLDIILMRKDPPVSLEYFYLTYILDYAEKAGVLVVNKPQGLREVNEKIVINQFFSCCVPTLVSSNIALLQTFWQQQKSENHDIICKPLNAMGGYSVFRLTPQDPNVSVLFEILTQQETCHIMVQRFIPEIAEGDKRVLLINGEPLPYMLARVPQKGEWRGNIVAGASGFAQALTKKERDVCEEIAPYLREQGLYFVGIDIIGDYLTEINVTSPSCIRELDEQCGLNVSAQLFDFLVSSVLFTRRQCP